MCIHPYHHRAATYLERDHSHNLHGSEEERATSTCFSTIPPQNTTSMSDPRFPHLEQDVSGNGDLPTYDSLAAGAGPNSRLVRCSVAAELQESQVAQVR